MIIIFASLAMLANGTMSQSSPGETLIGTWETKDRTATLRFETCEKTICGRLVSGKLGPAGGDLRGQNVITGIVREDVTAKRDQKKQPSWRGRFVGGGRNLKTTIRLTSETTADVLVCPASFMCRTQRIVRVKSN